MSAPRLIKGGLLIAGLLVGVLMVVSALQRRDGVLADGRIVLATYQVTTEYLPLERMGIIEGLTRAGFEFEPVEPALDRNRGQQKPGVKRRA